MNTLFDIVINYSEYQYFKTLSNPDKVQFLFQIIQSKQLSSKLDLSEFFKYIETDLQDTQESVDLPEIIEHDNPDLEFVDVMIDDENIMIESNSLKALRHVKNKFIESGYMLQRDLATEKMFRKDKTTRYIRVFRIINYTSSMCLN
jgi:hypothetical protein